MSTEEYKAIARRFYAAIDASQAQTAPPEISPDIVVHQTGAPGPLNLEAFQQFGRGFYEAFPDLQHVIVGQVAEGDRVVNRLIVRGTHRGSFQGIAPTGRQIAIEAISEHRLAGGQIVEQWIMFDTFGLMQQLGVMPAPN
jgi:predicted ester cyclase